MGAAIRCPSLCRKAVYCATPARFHAPAAVPDRPGQRHVSRSELLLGAPRAGRPRAPHLSVDSHVDRRLQHRRRACTSARPSCCAKRGCSTAPRCTRPDINPEALQQGRGSVSTRSERVPKPSPRTTGFGRRQEPLELAMSTTRPPTARPRSTDHSAKTWFFPTTAWRRTASSPRFSWCRAATCSSISIVHCKTAPSA